MLEDLNMNVNNNEISSSDKAPVGELMEHLQEHAHASSHVLHLMGDRAMRAISDWMKENYPGIKREIATLEFLSIFSAEDGDISQEERESLFEEIVIVMNRCGNKSVF